MFSLGASAGVLVGRKPRDPNAKPAAVAPPRAKPAATPPVPQRARLGVDPNRIDFVGSSNLTSAELEPGGTCVVEFANGSRYRYAGFVPTMIAAWRAAPSAGSWFHRNVKLQPKLHPLVVKPAAVPDQEDPAVKAIDVAPVFPIGNKAASDIEDVRAELEARPFTHTPVQAREPGTFVVPTLEETLARAAPVLARLIDGPPPVPTQLIPVVPVHVKDAAPFAGQQGSLSEFGVWIACPHHMLRSLAGGVCPVCPQRIGSNPVDGSPMIVPGSSSGGANYEALTKPPGVHVIPPALVGASADGAPVIGSHPGMGGAIAPGSSPGLLPTIRPPLVEPSPPEAPSGEAHGFDERAAREQQNQIGAEDHVEPAAPDYLKQPLRTLTRAEATELLTRLRARRMRARLSTFIRGPDGTGKLGAWHVLEDGELDWNFHHDAICDHVQLMFEEWELAGIKSPLEIERKLTEWRVAAELDRAFDPAGCERRIAQVEGMRAHWLRPTDQFVEVVTPTGTNKIYGCGGKRYQKRNDDLAINVGPISLKSRIVMVFALAWMWLRNPGWEVFCSSGTPSNVSRDSIATRDLVTNKWYRDTFGITWTIKADLDRVDKWGTTAGGSREARGAGTSVTGIHADALLLDDPDDAAGVWSEAERRNIMLFWKALGNRLKDPTRPVRIIVQQNLHEEDLSTRTVADGMPRLAIPVEFTLADRTKYYTAPFAWVDPRDLDGALLQASRFTAQYLADERVRLGTHGYEAQYNCNPRPIGGGMISRTWYGFFRIEDPTEDQKVDPRPRPTGCRGSGGEYGTILEHPTYTIKRKRNAPNRNEVEWLNVSKGTLAGELMLDWFTLSVDATFGSLKESASAVGLITVGGAGMRRFVFDDTTEPMTFHATVKAIKLLIRKWPIKRVLIEKKANGAAVIDELKLLLADGSVLGPDGRAATVVVEEVEVDGGKESRAAAMVPSIEAELWYLYEGAPWLERYLGELTTFPHSKRNDRVDATSQLASYYREPDVVSRWKKLAGQSNPPARA